MLSQKDLADKAGLGYNRLRAILGEANASDVELSEMYAIADAAMLPRRFMDVGFTPLKVIGNPLQSILEGIEDRLAALEAAQGASERAAQVARALAQGAQDRARRQGGQRRTAPGQDPPAAGAEGDAG